MVYDRSEGARRDLATSRVNMFSILHLCGCFQAAAAARAAQEQAQRAALAGKRPAEQSAADLAAKRAKKDGDVENDVLKVCSIAQQFFRSAQVSFLAKRGL